MYTIIKDKDPDYPYTVWAHTAHGGAIAINAFETRKEAVEFIQNK